MTIIIDNSELDALVAELSEVPTRTGQNTRKAVEVTALKVKKGWADRLKGEPKAPHAHRSITYDIEVAAGFEKSTIGAEIGAERGRLQAPIVTVLEFGAPVNNTSPHGYGLAALEDAEYDFGEGLLKAGAALFSGPVIL